MRNNAPYYTRSNAAPGRANYGNVGHTRKNEKCDLRYSAGQWIEKLSQIVAFFSDMIDMILIRRKWATSVQQCRTFQGADIDSDHSLVMANIKIKLKKKHKAQFGKRRDIARLSDEGISNAYRIALERHLGQAEPSQDLDENAKRIAMAMEKAAEKTIPEKR